MIEITKAIDLASASVIQIAKLKVSLTYMEWMCGSVCVCGLYYYAVEVKETRVSLFDWYEVLV